MDNLLFVLGLDLHYCLTEINKNYESLSLCYCQVGLDQCILYDV